MDVDILIGVKGQWRAACPFARGEGSDSLCCSRTISQFFLFCFGLFLFSLFILTIINHSLVHLVQDHKSGISQCMFSLRPNYFKSLGKPTFYYYFLNIHSLSATKEWV